MAARSPRVRGSRPPELQSPTSADHRVSDGVGVEGFDSDGLDARDGDANASSPHREPLEPRKRALEILGILFPWMLSLGLGFCVALTGSYISLNCDFLGDFRFGFCRGLLFVDRGRCCGGAENVDYYEERCLAPAALASGMEDYQPLEWVPWAEFFGLETRVKSWAGYTLSFVVYLLASMLWTGLATFLVFEYCPAAKGSGIPETKAAVSGFDLPQSFSGWCLLIKALGLSLVVGAGLSLGKEGPLIHIGVCWAYLIQRLVARPVVDLGLPSEVMPLHELACVGAAAGVSTAFGAPLGGVLFAAEELGSVRSLSRRTLLFAFMASFSASFVLKYLNLSGANRLTLFALSTSTHSAKKEWVAWEMLAFLPLGAVGGLIGALFVKMNIWVAKRRMACQKEGRLWMMPKEVQARFFGWRLTPRMVNVVEGILIAFVTSLLNYPFTTLLRTLSTEAIHALFETCPHGRASRFGLCSEQDFNMDHSISASLLLAAGVRLIQTTYTFGAGLPSGLFIPSLFIGACVGRFVGNSVLVFNEYLDEYKLHIEPGVFAMVGAISVLAGFCRMTVSIVVIMFELTGELTYIVPFMCAVLTAKLVGDSITPSIYDAHAKLRGIGPIEEPHDVRLEMVVVDLAAPVAAEDILDVGAAYSFEALASLLKGSAFSGSRPGSSPFGMPQGSEKVPLVSAPEHGGDVLLLVSSSGDGPQAPAKQVLAVVERSRLALWLSRQSSDPDALCSFKRVAETSTGAVQNEEEGSPLHAQQKILDASGVAETHFARLSPHAPLLTAHCVFDQKPKLRYCVCFDERRPSAFSVLSRDGFKSALWEPRCPLARPPLSSETGPVGAAAAAEMLGQSLRDFAGSWRQHLGLESPTPPGDVVVVGARGEQHADPESAETAEAAGDVELEPFTGDGTAPRRAPGRGSRGIPAARAPDS